MISLVFFFANHVYEHQSTTQESRMQYLSPKNHQWLQFTRENRSPSKTVGRNKVVAFILHSQSGCLILLPSFSSQYEGVDFSWTLLMRPEYVDLRAAIYCDEKELRREIAFAIRNIHGKNEIRKYCPQSPRNSPDNSLSKI